MMSEPARWRDMGSDAPMGARELLLSARRPVPMSAEVRARTAARVAAIAATPVATGLFVKWLTGKTIGLLAAFSVLGAAIGLVAYVVTRTPSSSTPPPKGTTQPAMTAAASSTATSSASASTPSAPGSSPTVSTTPSVPSVVTTGTATPSASTPKTDGRSEEQYLDDARAKLATDPAGALKDLDAYPAKYPKGQMGAEREVMSIDALKRLGRTAEAKKRGEAFLAAHPKSLYSERVRKMIEGL